MNPRTRKFLIALALIFGLCGPGAYLLLRNDCSECIRPMATALIVSDPGTVGKQQYRQEVSDAIRLAADKQAEVIGVHSSVEGSDLVMKEELENAIAYAHSKGAQVLALQAPESDLISAGRDAKQFDALINPMLNPCYEGRPNLAWEAYHRAKGLSTVCAEADNELLLRMDGLAQYLTREQALQHDSLPAVVLIGTDVETVDFTSHETGVASKVPALYVQVMLVMTMQMDETRSVNSDAAQKSAVPAVLE